MLLPVYECPKTGGDHIAEARKRFRELQLQEGIALPSEGYFAASLVKVVRPSLDGSLSEFLATILHVTVQLQSPGCLQIELQVRYTFEIKLCARSLCHNTLHASFLPTTVVFAQMYRWMKCCGLCRGKRGLLPGALQQTWRICIDAHQYVHMYRVISQARGLWWQV